MKLFVALSVCLNNKEMFNPYYGTMIPWAPGWLMIQPWRPSQLAHVDANEKNTWEVAVSRMTIEDENVAGYLMRCKCRYFRSIQYVCKP
jgi:hypothetical protein